MSGRTYDIAAWTTDDNGRLHEDPQNGGRITGTAKLIQRVYIALLQDRESVAHCFGRNTPMGSCFMTMMHNGLLRTETDVFAAFGLARPLVRVALQADETNDDPDDERFKDMTLKGIEIELSGMVLTVEIQSLAGTVTAYFPIAIE